MIRGFLVGLFFCFSLFASECVCFELKGEFGDEIREILKKHAKNLGSDDIKIVKESEMDLSKEKNDGSFLDSLKGLVAGSDYMDDKIPLLEDGGKFKANLSRAERIYTSQCSSCHGEGAENRIIGDKMLLELDRERIVDALYSYRTGDYDGSSRFVKNSIASSMTKDDIESLADYIGTFEKLKIFDYE